jgi:hypothetical protein
VQVSLEAGKLSDLGYLPPKLKADRIMELGVGVMETILASGVPAERLALYAGAALSSAFRVGARSIASIRTQLGFGEGVLEKLASAKNIADHARYVSGLKDLQRSFYFNELESNGVKFTPGNVLDIQRMPDGRLAFLESGSSNGGLAHILEHAPQFAKVGIRVEQIPEAVMTAVTRGKIVGYQGKDIGRPIFDFVFNDTRQRMAVTVGENGFIVGANPKPRPGAC